MDAGSAGGNVSVACKMNASPLCIVTTYVGAVAAVTDAGSMRATCVSGGGTVVVSCPTTDLIGCCTTKDSILGTGENCNYIGTGTAASEQSFCTSIAGTWTTTP